MTSLSTIVEYSQTMTPPIVPKTATNGHQKENGLPSSAELAALLKKDPYFYGYRDVYQTNENGKEELVRVALTFEDILHPQNGDHIMHRSDHGEICYYVRSAILSTINDPTVVVFNDVGVDWHVPGEKHYSPDVSVIFNIREKKDWGIFDVVKEGTAPSLVVEVTSRSTRSADLVDKLAGYECRRVPYYMIIDPLYRPKGKREQKKQGRVLGYRLTPNGYVELTPNVDGWLWMDPVNLWVSIEENEVRCYNAQGEYIPDVDELAQQLADVVIFAEQESQKAILEAQRADKEVAARQIAEDEIAQLRAEIARLRQQQGG